MNRIPGSTPAGGDYSEIFFFDADGHIVEKERAVRCVIRECKSDGTLLQETFGFVAPSTVQE